VFECSHLRCVLRDTAVTHVGLAAPTPIGEGGSMHGEFASVITEAWGSLGERRFLFLTLLGFVCAFG
jgi:hypothetical protein